MSETKSAIIPIDLDGVNCYLLSAGNGFVLVDTGGHLTMDKTFDNRREKLMKALSSAGCKKGDLKLILLTHGDNDHVANAAFLKKQFDAPIALHPSDIPLVKEPTLDMMMGSFQYESVLLRIIFRVMRKKIRQVTQKALNDFEKFKPDVLLTDGMDLKDYGLDATVLHLPGHTPGSVGILLNDGSLIAGDTLVNTGKPAAALNAADFKVLHQSIARLQSKAIQTVYPGHGQPFSFRTLG